jgi:hypothetical protein
MSSLAKLALVLVLLGCWVTEGGARADDPIAGDASAPPSHEGRAEVLVAPAAANWAPAAANRADSGSTSTWTQATSLTRKLRDSSIGSDLTHVDAFWRLPSTLGLSTAEDLDYSAHPASFGANPTDEFVGDYRFDGPARFPLRNFGLNGHAGEDVGAIIYEGMRLAVKEGGRYQVRFVLGTPAMPVTMRKHSPKGWIGRELIWRRLGGCSIAEHYECFACGTDFS